MPVIKKKYVPLKIWLSRNAINSDRPTSAENPQTSLGCVCVCVCVCVCGGGGGGGVKKNTFNKQNLCATCAYIIFPF